MAYNQADQYFEPTTDTDANFGNSVSGQNNSFFLPAVYSKNILSFFRKKAVGEAITNTDYAGDITQFGDTVNIIKEPTITVYQYERGQNVTATKLTDEELTLIVDTANAFKFIVDDIEAKMSHVNWREAAGSAAAYALADAFDENIFTKIAAGVSASAPDNIIGGDAAVGSAGLEETTASVDLGQSEVDPLDLMARMARLLDDQNVPEEGRWFVGSPRFYEELSKTASKLMSVDYNGGMGSLRNGLVSQGQLRGFTMYKSNNVPAPSTATGQVLCGHISAVATAQTITQTEVLRDPDSFGDIVRGLHVHGIKVLRPEALSQAYYTID